MTSSLPHSRSDHNPILVLDASVAINLLGTGRPADLLRIVGQRVVIEENAYKEVVRDPFNGNSGCDSLNTLISMDLLRLERLSNEGYELFLELTGADPPDDLDDGEAATIAYSLVVRGIPLLDERKAKRIAQKRGLSVMTTLDLLRSQQIVDTLGRNELANVLYNAISHARMRVPSDDRQWVGNMIGTARAASCSSLGPSCRKRR